jgi:biopolymer transport protein ExbB/TolQ
MDLDLNTAAWILIMFLSGALLIFLILTIALVVKLIGVAKEVKKIIIAGQSIVEKADGIVENIQDVSTVRGLVRAFLNKPRKRLSRKNKHHEQKEKPEE